MVIPVPEAESNIAYYESLYPGDFRMPKQLIHIQREYSAFIQTKYLIQLEVYVSSTPLLLTSLNCDTKGSRQWITNQFHAFKGHSELTWTLINSLL